MPTMLIEAILQEMVNEVDSVGSDPIVITALRIMKDEQTEGQRSSRDFPLKNSHNSVLAQRKTDKKRSSKTSAKIDCLDANS